MRLLKHIVSLWKAIPVEEKGDRRTRWLLTLLSFLILSVLMISAFIASLFKEDTDIALALVDLVKHLSYVFGAVVGAYFGLESLFPSSDRPYWSAWGGGHRSRKDDPPVGPDADDVQVE